MPSFCSHSSSSKDSIKSSLLFYLKEPFQLRYPVENFVKSLDLCGKSCSLNIWVKWLLCNEVNHFVALCRTLKILSQEFLILSPSTQIFSVSLWILWETDGKIWCAGNSPAHLILLQLCWSNPQCSILTKLSSLLGEAQRQCGQIPRWDS